MKDFLRSSARSSVRLSTGGLPPSFFDYLNAWRLWVFWGSVGCVGLMLAISLQPFFSVSDLTRDPATIALHPPFFGLTSNLAILLWSASAAVCFLSSVLLKVIRPERRGLHSFFMSFAVLNTLLCLDDTFLLHEAILPNRLPVISIPEPVVVMGYGLFLLGAMVYFRRQLLQSQPLLFGVSLFLFAVSVGVDLLLPELYAEDVVLLIEDGAKLLAIFLWLAYFVQVSVYFVAAVTGPQLASSAETVSAEAGAAQLVSVSANRGRN